MNSQYISDSKGQTTGVFILPVGVNLTSSISASLQLATLLFDSLLRQSGRAER